MQSIASIITKLKANYPRFSFLQSDNFWWSPSENTIHYNAKVKDSAALLIHELSHALLGHKGCISDVKLITMERQAWDYASKIAPFYDIKITNKIIQQNLDSYRDWIYRRSTCPKCSAIGLQDKKNIYKCLACNNKWQVNQAKECKLRRYSI